MSDFSELRKSLGIYIDKYPPPTKEQNTTWLKELKILDHTSKAYFKLREKIILSNGGFAMKYVMKYKGVLNDDVSVMDLFQEATLGLIETIDSFNTELDTRFTTYAHFHVKKRMIDFIKKNKLVRAPRDIARNMKKVDEVRCKLFTELEREPTANEIVEELNNSGIELTPEMVINIITLLELNSASNDDSFICEFTEQVSEEKDDHPLFKMMESYIDSKLANEDETIRKMAKLRFGIGTDSTHTLEEVKYILNINQNETTFIPLSDKHLEE